MRGRFSERGHAVGEEVLVCFGVFCRVPKGVRLGLEGYVTCKLWWLVSLHRSCLVVVERQLDLPSVTVLEDSSSTRLLPLGWLRSGKKKPTVFISSCRRRRECSRDLRKATVRTSRSENWKVAPPSSVVLGEKATLKSSLSGRRQGGCRDQDMESYLNPVYGDENQDAAFYTTQDYEESLPHDLLEESTWPWVAKVHASDSHRLDKSGPSLNVCSPHADELAAQLMCIIPQLDQSQIQNLMTALKGKATSSPSPRAGASRPMASTSSLRIITGPADITLIRPRAI
ncbi:hypothetical protein Taro_052130 [Colocasia esculenta]|uniref:Uncharacterized protein n=1 Tax=Colocasia esculenta TaxID=4460 RepID=A0A843XIU2_COLES|nr:hypothetical protein [Colocasia esculenta]